MQFSIVAALSLASIAVADQVLTQIGDGQIQAPTTENQTTVATTTAPAPAPPAETTTAPAPAPPAATTTAPAPAPPAQESTTAVPAPPASNSTVPEFENAAPRAVIGGGLAAIAGLAALL
jgi:hypothetical protein